MDLDVYRNFLVLAESDTFSAAARKLNIVQTALGSQINKLEDYYGVQLVKRQKGVKHIELTSAGLEFAQKARQLCHFEDELALGMQKYSGNVTGTLRFGVSPMRSSYLIEAFLMPFVKLHPNIIIEYEEMVTVAQVEKLRSGALDFAFSNASTEIYPEFGMLHFEQEQFYVIYRQGLEVPWAEKQELELTDLVELPLCSYFTQFSMLRRICEEQGLRLQPRFITNTLSNTLTVVKNSNNIGVVAVTASEKLPQGLERKLLRGSQMVCNQIFYWNKNRSMSVAAETFLQFFLERAQAKDLLLKNGLN